MKNLKILPLLFIVFLFNSCVKKSDKWVGDTSKMFTVTGYIYKRTTTKPVQNYGIAIRQTDADFDPRYDYKPTDPHAFTDSAGKFVILYYPTNYNGGINLYNIPSSYSCTINIDILDNIQKGVDISIGKIYID